MKLLIIDEVHLLNDERGAVIETIVARTLRLVRLFPLRFRIAFCNFRAGRVDAISHSNRRFECYVAKLRRRRRIPQV